MNINCQHNVTFAYKQDAFNEIWFYADGCLNSKRKTRSYNFDKNMAARLYQYLPVLCFYFIVYAE